MGGGKTIDDKCHLLFIFFNEGLRTFKTLKLSSLSPQSQSQSQEDLGWDFYLTWDFAGTGAWTWTGALQQYFYLVYSFITILTVKLHSKSGHSVNNYDKHWNRPGAGVH